MAPSRWVQRAGRDSTLSQADYHQAFWGEVEPKEGRFLTPAKAINHTDEELEILARLVNQHGPRGNATGQKGHQGRRLATSGRKARATAYPADMSKK
jgi:hypothetical protein